MSDDVLVKVDGVSKKFCRSLKRSLWYGVKDVGSELFGREGGHGELRKNEFWAVDDVSFELRRGECLGLIGPNGAGKSTLLKMLNGLVKPDMGRITMRGRVGALIELGAGFNPILTARENIYVNGSVLGFSTREIDQKFDAIVDFAELEKFIETPVQNFSSGMKVRLGFAVAAQMEPEVLLIDEVLAVGDTGFRAKCYKVIGELSTKAAVILVSHSMPIISRICSSALVVNNGKDIYYGLPARAIETYYELLPIQNSSELLKSKEIKIEGIDIYPCSNIETGKAVKLVASLESSKHWDNIELNFVLLNRELTPVCQFSSRANGAELDLEKGNTTVEVHIPSLQLNPGIYGVSLTVEEISSRRKLCWQHNAIELSVTGSFHGNAPYQGVGEWSVN